MRRTFLTLATLAAAAALAGVQDTGPPSAPQPTGVFPVGHLA